MNFSARLAGLKILARFEGPITWRISSRAEISARLTGLKFQPGFCNKSFENQIIDYMEMDSARAELRPGLNPSPCNRQLGFQRICFRSRSEISARDEIRHVIGPSQ